MLPNERLSDIKAHTYDRSKNGLRAMLKAIHDGDPETIYRCTHKFYRDIEMVRNGYSKLMPDQADLAEVCGEFADGLQGRLQQIAKIATHLHDRPLKMTTAPVACPEQTLPSPPISHAPRYLTAKV
jgi:hypothetical protein